MKLNDRAAIRSTLTACIITLIIILAADMGVRRVAATEPLSVNHSPYSVQVQIVPAIKGLPNCPMPWSGWKDSVPSSKVSISRGHWADFFGVWLATGNSWTEDLIVRRKTTARVSEQVSTLALQVPPRPSYFANKVGQYFWTPPHGTPQSLDYAADRISNLGARTMHTAFFTSCSPQQTLLQHAQMDDARRAFSHPNIKTYVLTTYGASGCGFVDRLLSDPIVVPFFNAKLYPAVAPSIEQDYRELTLHLYQTYQGSGKRFVISTWEGDNVLHCGSAYWYAHNLRIAPGPDGIARDVYGYPMRKDPNDPAGRSIPFRSYCDEIYPRMGIANVNEAHEGYRLWLEARQRGIRQGRDEAARLGLAGVAVYHAAEINVVNLLEHPLGVDGQPLTKDGQPVRLPSILRDVLPRIQGGLDFVSYSAYETTNLKAPDESMASLQARIIRDLETTRQISGTRNIIIGEFGYARRSAFYPFGLTDDQVVKRTDEVINAALYWGVVAIYTWQMYDDYWGTFDSQGNLLLLGDYFRHRYRRL